jgi:hypothetical protein
MEPEKESNLQEGRTLGRLTASVVPNELTDIVVDEMVESSSIPHSVTTIAIDWGK